MGFLETIAGPVLQSAASIFGGQMDAAQERQQQRHQDDMQRIAWQRDDTAIARRVADAKAAGVHPLYAMGAQVPQSAIPQYIGQSGGGAGVAEAGQSLGTAISRMKSPEEKLKDQLEIRLAESQIKETDARAGYYTSMAAREAQAGGAGMHVQEKRGKEVIEGQAPNPPGAGAYELEPPKWPTQKLGEPGVKAGIGQGYEERMLTEGFPMVMPDSGQESPEEIFSEMSLPAFYGMLEMNERRYGKGWMLDFIKWRYFGEKPKGTYQPLVEQTPKSRTVAPPQRRESEELKEILKRKRG